MSFGSGTTTLLPDESVVTSVVSSADFLGMPITCRVYEYEQVSFKLKVFFYGREKSKRLVENSAAL